MKRYSSQSSVCFLNILNALLLFLFIWFRAFSAITFSLSACGRVVAFVPDMRRATDAAKKILLLLDRISQIPADEGFVPQEPFDGKVVIRDIKFRYPTRIHVPVLRVSLVHISQNKWLSTSWILITFPNHIVLLYFICRKGIWRK